MSRRALRWRRSSRSPHCRSRRLVSFLDPRTYSVIARESGRSSIPEHVRLNGEARGVLHTPLAQGITRLDALRARASSNLLIVFTDLGMAAQHLIHRLEHVAHALFADRAFDHHHQLRLVGGSPRQAPAAVFNRDAHAVDGDEIADRLTRHLLALFLQRLEMF